MIDDAATTDHSTPHDLVTVVAIAVTVYVLGSVIHEGLGHGGACVVTGAHPRVMSSMHFDCTLPVDTPTRQVIIAAAGTLVQLVIGFAAFAWYRVRLNDARRSGTTASAYAAWLFAAVNLMQGFGYFLFSGVGGIGDWATVFAAVHPSALWRVPLAVGGFALYWATTARLFRALLPFLGGSLTDRLRHARRLALVPYLSGGLLGLVTGLRNPAGLGLLVVSGLAATLGGTSGLAWGPQTLRGEPVTGSEGPTLVVPRSWPAVMAGVIAAAFFVWFLGPGIQFG